MERFVPPGLRRIPHDEAAIPALAEPAPVDAAGMPGTMANMPLETIRSVPRIRSVPMPSLPRIRRTRSRDLDGRSPCAPRQPAELSAAGLTWIHLDAPTLEAAQELAERFGWHPLDVEDVLSKRQRPKVDDYADEGYLFTVLHFPAYDRRSSG